MPFARLHPSVDKEQVEQEIERAGSKPRPKKKPDKRKSAGCEHKQKYPSKTVAEQVLKTIRRHGRNGSSAMTCYRCVFCHYWHLGTSSSTN